MNRSASAHHPSSHEATDDRFADGLGILGVAIPAAAGQQLARYLDLLAKWNGVYNLTAIRDVRDMLPVHLFDSLAILPLVDELQAATILDVGSGAGLPGIPLAIARPRLQVMTVDAVAKKIAFQHQVKAELGLPNLTPVHSRVEALALLKMPAAIVSRAYAALPELLRAIGRSTDETTQVIAMKGTRPDAEIATLPSGWQVTQVRELNVPFLGARRCAVVLSRIA